MNNSIINTTQACVVSHHSATRRYIHYKCQKHHEVCEHKYSSPESLDQEVSKRYATFTMCGSTNDEALFRYAS